MIKAVIFDYDGVLVDSNSFNKQALRNAAEELGLKYTDSDHQKYIVGFSLKEGSENYLGDLGKKSLIKQFIELKKSQDPTYKKTIMPISESIKLIKQLRNSYQLAICSGSRKILVDAYISKFDLAKTFKVIVTSDDVKKSKPDPESYLLTLKKLGLKSNEVVATEDSRNGILSAKAAGCFCIAITTTQNKKGFTDADKITDSFEKVEKLISKINS